MIYTVKNMQTFSGGRSAVNICNSQLPYPGGWRWRERTVGILDTQGWGVGGVIRLGVGGGGGGEVSDVRLVISLLISTRRQNISPCVDWEQKKNYSVQVFKTMQDVHGWIGSFYIAFAAYCCGIFVSASFFVLYNFKFQLTIWSWIHVSATYQIFVVFPDIFAMFFRKSTQNTRELGLQWVKDVTSLSCVQLLVILALLRVYMIYTVNNMQIFSGGRSAVNKCNSQLPFSGGRRWRERTVGIFGHRG